MHLVRLIIQFLKCLCIEHPHKEVEGVVVAVRDDAEDGLLALAQLLQFQRVPGGDALDFMEGKYGQPHSGAHQDRAGSFARGLFEDVVLPHRDVVRLFFLQRLEQKV